MILPSKELLSEVLGHSVDNVKRYTDENNGNCLSYSIDLFDNGSMYNEQIINIYELMHMMKEWAVTKRYSLESGISSQDQYCIVLDRHGNSEEVVSCGTEPEAVMKACEWILNEITN